MALCSALTASSARDEAAGPCYFVSEAPWFLDARLGGQIPPPISSTKSILPRGWLSGTTNMCHLAIRWIWLSTMWRLPYLDARWWQARTVCSGKYTSFHVVLSCQLMLEHPSFNLKIALLLSISLSELPNIYVHLFWSTTCQEYDVFPNFSQSVQTCKLQPASSKGCYLILKDGVFWHPLIIHEKHPFGRSRISMFSCYSVINCSLMDFLRHVISVDHGLLLFSCSRTCKRRSAYVLMKWPGILWSMWLGDVWNNACFVVQFSRCLLMIFVGAGFLAVFRKMNL